MTVSSRPQTLGQLILRKAERLPDTAVLRFVSFEHSDEVVTYSTLAIQSHKLAVALRSMGITHGTTFGVMLRNHPEFVYALVAASLVGAVLVPIDPRIRGDALRHQLAHSACRGLLVADYALAQVIEVLQQLPASPIIQVLHTGETGAPEQPVTGFAALNACFERPEVYVDHPVEEARQAVEILYTSGTTGLPKGVVIDNQRLLDFRGLGKFIFGYTAEDRLYTGLSLAHGNAQSVTLMGALGQGIEAIFSRRFTKSRLWELTRMYGITVLSLLGGMATAIYSAPVRPDDGDNPVRLITSAGMPAPLWKAFEKRFHVRILEWYGAVEGGFVYKPVGEGPEGSFGRLSPGYEVRVVDAQDRECLPGEVGELIFRPLEGPVQMAYWHDATATRQKVQAGWLRSGDMVHRDTEGYCFFHYRQGDAIRRNGEFINPDEVARILAEHPEVTDVFVYGVPAYSGAPGEQDIVAAVVPIDQQQLDTTSLFAACHRRLPPNAVPSYLHVVPEIPRTLSEKPQKHRLLESFDLCSPNVFTRRVKKF